MTGTAEIRGVGLHSGLATVVRLYPDDPTRPVRFRRGHTEIPARLEHVIYTERCTVLGAEGAQVALVEHLLAALHVGGWWRGLVIEVTADELPVLDGSAAPWAEALKDLGTPPPAPAVLEPPATQYEEAGTQLLFEPGAQALEVAISFPHPLIGSQSWQGTPESYLEVLAARTFGFLHEAQALQARGLARGASLENSVVFTNDGTLTALRYKDEPVRHKALDALGDFFLLGAPLGGHLRVTRGSHRLHVAFARQLEQQVRSGTESNERVSESNLTGHSLTGRNLTGRNLTGHSISCHSGEQKDGVDNL